MEDLTEAEQHIRSAFEADNVRVSLRSVCPICSKEGKTLYTGLVDYMFGAEGEWNYRICAECHLAWIERIPNEEELTQAYGRYYTHGAVSLGERSATKRCYGFIKKGYCAGKFGYRSSLGEKLVGQAMYALPMRRHAAECEMRFIQAREGGRLLDAGCGSGSWLARMRDWGWTAQGVDFDPKAVEAARNAGLDVRCGTLEAQNFSANSFDIVTLHHVIEHVPDPLITLEECFRILKPGGKLIIGTPNLESLGHRIFRRNWRGLEPPRHLHIFSHRSLNQMLARAGFVIRATSADIGKSVLCESYRIQCAAKRVSYNSARRLLAPIAAGIVAYIELMFRRIYPEWADCFISVAEKNPLSE